MSEQLFSKEQLLSFIEKFEENTNRLIQPMISWAGDGAYELAEAKEMVEDGFLTYGVVMCAKRNEEEYWDSVFITIDDDGDFEISTGDMSGIADVHATSIDEALEEAQDMLFEYINQ